MLPRRSQNPRPCQGTSTAPRERQTRRLPGARFCKVETVKSAGFGAGTPSPRSPSLPRDPSPAARQFGRLPGSAAPQYPGEGDCRHPASPRGHWGALCSGCHRDQRFLMPPRAGWQSHRQRAAPSPNEVVKLVCNACLNPAPSDAPARRPWLPARMGMPGGTGHNVKTRIQGEVGAAAAAGLHVTLWAAA